LLRSGERAEARSIVDDLLADVRDPFPRDLIWLLGHVFIAEVAAALGTSAQCEREFEALAPYSGRVPYAGNVIFAGVDLRLATLAARAGWPEEAERYFAAADALHMRLDAPIWLAETRLEWGRFLLDREPARAVELLKGACEQADRMGAADIVAATKELLANF